jgi:ADP-heptose:LPS heptosyltransferase
MVVTDYKMREIRNVEIPTFNFAQLHHMAFNGDYHSVYSLMTKIPPTERRNIADKYILFETIAGSVKKLNEVKNKRDDFLLSMERKFLLEILDQFISVCKGNSNFPRHLFLSILKVSYELVHLSEFDLAIDYLKVALKYGAEKFPDIKTEVIFRLADIYNKQGDINTSNNYVNQLINHPYFITDKNRISELITNVSQIYLKQGNVDKYKTLLFQGLRYFYTNPDNRRKIYDQIHDTYRSSIKLLVNSNVTFSHRLFYFIHWIYFKIPNFSQVKLSFINKLALKFLLGIIYLSNYVIKNNSSGIFFRGDIKPEKKLQFLKGNDYAKSFSKHTPDKKILITRAMGGIGDFLMMTPGIHALTKKYPKSEIHLAIPKRYFPIFEGNDDVKLLDIEGDFFSHLKFNRWFNFTDCPAARKESIASPKVRKSRTEIFSSALKINFFSRLTMPKKPLFFFSQDELDFASQEWKELRLGNKTVIGVQLHSDETYRDYPLMEKLVEQLAKKYTVMLFDSEPISGFEFENVIKIQNLSIRRAFALAQMCNIIIAPDSSFVHFAAAFDIPTIALFGPIDGKVRTKHYPKCTYLSSEEILGCLPCWRNEEIPCKLTGMRTSECMKAIQVSKIINTLEKNLNGEN